MIDRTTHGSDAVGQSRNEKPRRGRTRRGQIVSSFCTRGLLMTGPAAGHITDDFNGIDFFCRPPQQP